MQLLTTISKFLLLTSLAVWIVACGGGGSTNNAGGGTTSTLNGTAATGIAIDGIVYVTDSTGTQINVPLDSTGNYTADITNMTPPFILSAVPSNISLPTQYSYATGPGTTNITPLTTLTLFNATNQTDLSILEANWLTQSGDVIAANLEQAQAQINANFAAAFSALSIDANTYDFFSDAFSVGAGFDLVLDTLDIDIDFSNSTFTISLNNTPYTYDFNVDINEINIGGTGGGGISTGNFGTLTITGSDAGIIGASFTPGTVTSNAPTVSSINWILLGTALGTGTTLGVDGVFGTSLTSGGVFFTFTRTNPNEGYGYGLPCSVSPTECAKIAIDLEAKTMTFNDVVIANTPGNSATAPITIRGTVTWQ